MGVTIVVFKERRNAVYISINGYGRQRRLRTGLHLTGDRGHDREVMRIASGIRAKVELELVAKRNGFTTERQRRVTVCEYLSHMIEVKGPGCQFHKLIPYVERYGDIRIMAVTTAWFTAFQSWMERDNSLAPATSERYVCRLRESLKLAVREGLLQSDPSEGVRHIRVPESGRPHLVASEVSALVRTPCRGRSGEEIKRGFLLAVCTGLRVSDIKALRWADIDLAGRQLAKRMVKTGRMVYVPLNRDALSLLAEAAEADGGRSRDLPVFPYISKADTPTMNRNLRRWAEDAGVEKNLTWHVARHTLATQLIESGADLYTVQRTLGHTKIQTTEIYARVSDRRKREALDSLPDYGITAPPAGGTEP